MPSALVLKPVLGWLSYLAQDPSPLVRQWYAGMVTLLNRAEYIHTWHPCVNSCCRVRRTLVVVASGARWQQQQ
jgi:hypothetical protein